MLGAWLAVGAWLTLDTRLAVGTGLAVDTGLAVGDGLTVGTAAEHPPPRNATANATTMTLGPCMWVTPPPGGMGRPRFDCGMGAAVTDFASLHPVKG